MKNNTPVKRLSSPIELGLLFTSIGVLIFISACLVRAIGEYIHVHYNLTGQVTLWSILLLIITMEYIEWRRNAPYRPRRVDA